ncbi:protein kinase domain-containing protein [Gemmatimonas sp.]|uniref:protein kinase domain-containing protein n=1 Tax=Gemmatimonas sp. TaxID=1962908 RepID=UPI00356B2B40
MNILERLTTALRGSYRVEREIGAGGMAAGYLAHDLRHDREVAIKVLHPDLAAALGGERFLSEIRTTARLQHPHILPLLDSGEADTLLYYVMPLVTGETLRARIERERQLLIGSTRHRPSINAAAWHELADQCGLGWDRVFDVVRDTVRRVDAALPDVFAQARAEGMPAELATDFQQRLAKRVRRCLHLLGVTCG